MTLPTRLAGDQCALHRYHRPAVLETERHHVWPLGMGGPDTPDNIVNVCPTSHSAIHVLIRALVKGQALPKAGRRERYYATRGFLEWVKAGKPGRIV